MPLPCHTSTFGIVFGFNVYKHPGEGGDMLGPITALAFNQNRTSRTAFSDGLEITKGL